MNNYLKTKYLGKEIFEFKEIDSTQKEIWRKIENGSASNGCLVIAEKQTSGIGTHGRKWYTDSKNITFSFSIFPNCNISKLEKLTYRIAEILKEVFKDLYNICLDIKLPNDLMINGKKVGGILTETKLQGEIVKVLVIGIGINTEITDFPEELEDKATSIKKEFNIEVANFWLIFRFLEQFESNFRSVFLGGRYENRIFISRTRSSKPWNGKRFI